MAQLSLFPDGFELQERALAALRDLDTVRARTFLQKARATGVVLANLEGIEAAVAWLHERLPGPADAAAVASLLHEVTDTVPSATLPPAAGEFLDQALARFAVRRGFAEVDFLDAGESIPGALLDLILGDGARAHPRLRGLLTQHRRGRADLWGWFADAALLVGRPAEAAAACVRALVLDAARLDLWRCRNARLRELHERLCQQHPRADARELLLTEAFLAGILPIPTDNGWLDAAAARRALAAAPATPAAPTPARQRRFARLLYADRTAGAAAVDFDRRDEMQALCPELFPRFLEHCSAEEARARQGPRAQQA